MAGLRSDGRTSTDMRPVQIQLGQLARADGSARFGFGSTACLASFTGPIEVRIREEMPDKATLEVSHRPLGSVGATPSRALEAALESAFTPLLSLGQHPRSLLQLVIQSLSAPANSFDDLGSSASQRRHDQYSSDLGAQEDDEMNASSGSQRGPSKLHTWPKAAVPSQAISAPSTQISFSERAAALNAASLAILDSGSIASSGVLVAVSTALVGARANAYAYVDTADANGSGAEEALELIMDPTPEEEERAVARYGIAWAFGKGLSTVKKEDGAQSGMQHDGDEEKEAAVCWVESEGRFSREQFKSAMAASREAAESILDVYRTELQKHLESRQRGGN